MHFSPSSLDQDGTFGRTAIIALVGALFVSTIAGAIAAPPVAAQQNGSNGSVGGNTSGNSTGGLAGNATASSGRGNNSTAANPVNATIQEFRRQDLGYSNLSAAKKQEVRSNLQQLYGGNVSQLKENRLIGNVQTILSSGLLMSPGEYNKPKNIIKDRLNASSELTTDGDPTDSSPLSRLDIPSLMGQKMESVGDTLKEGAANVLANVYNLGFQTPVPQNDGWQGILGTPTNEPFQPLYNQLLEGKLYPVLNYLLGMAVIVMGISLVVNPLMSRFRALNLMIKFVSFLLLYVSSWATVTLMHGAVNDITVWLRPSEQAMQALATNVTKLSAGAIGAYFIGAGGMLATVFSLGLELGLRKVALQYFFPYIFPVLLLLLYVSPWQRLKSFASVVLWQYVNVLAMVIPIAILLKAAAIVSFSTSSGVVAMLVLIALFLFAVSIPTITTYTFLQVPGKAASVGKSAAAGAASRASTAKDKLGWGGDDSASTGTATGDTSPGSRTEQAVEVSTDGGTTGIPSSGELSPEQVESIDPTGESATTAGQVRDLEQAEHQDPMNPSAMKESYFEDHPQRMTMDEKLASQS